MSSWQSIFYRQLSRVYSLVLSSRKNVAGWRALAKAGSRQPRLPSDVSMESFQIGSIPAEWLVPAGSDPRRVILYLHGGGWILGWYNAHRLMVSRLARTAGARALAIDYRLAPEYPYPAALEDCLDAYHYLLHSGLSPQQVVIAGDSAGGNLTLATLLALKQAGEALPAAGVCLSPATDLGPKANFDWKKWKDVILPVNFAISCSTSYLGGQDPTQPLISPIYGDLHGLPPILIQAGGAEMLLDDANRFAEKARQAGVDVSLDVFPGMWHVWQIYAPRLPEANQALQKIGEFINRHTRIPDGSQVETQVPVRAAFSKN